MYSKTEPFIQNLNTDNISAERKAIFQPLFEFIQHKVNAKEDV